VGDAPPERSAPPEQIRDVDHLRRARLRLAALFATELCDLPLAVWRARSEGAARSQLARIDDDVTLADIVAEAWDLARTRPVTTDQVTWQSGPGGAVVLAHGHTWSLLARAGGPVLVLSEAFTDVVRLEDSTLWKGELAILVGELLDAARGLPPFDETTLPPPPPLPWHPKRHD
jgi:hypothetical protein